MSHFGPHVIVVEKLFILLQRRRKCCIFRVAVSDNKRASPTYESEMECTRNDGVLSSLSRGEECADKQGSGDMPEECLFYVEGRTKTKLIAHRCAPYHGGEFSAEAF